MSETVLQSSISNSAMRQDKNFDLLCACASANPCAVQIERIASWNCTNFGWEGFLQLAEHHGLLPLAARNLISHAKGLAPEVEQPLRSAYAANLRRSLWFATELSRIVGHFAQRQVRALPYKGPVLAQSAYGDLALRSFSDLDFLIMPADFERAKHALAEIGYRASQDVAPSVEHLWLRTGYERSFDGAAGKNLVELQWNLLPHFYAVDFRSADFRVENLLDRSGRIDLGATEVRVQLLAEQQADVPCLSLEDSLLVMCLHAAKHLWMRLIWVADIAESLRAPEIDFALVISRAKALGVTRMLAVSFWLADNLLGATIPSAAREALGDDPEVPLLGRTYAERLTNATTYDFESTEYFRQMWNLREQARDRWRYLWRLIWTPGPGDVAVVALPEVLFPLYRVVRIARLMRRLARGRVGTSLRGKA